MLVVTVTYTCSTGEVYPRLYARTRTAVCSFMINSQHYTKSACLHPNPRAGRDIHTVHTCTGFDHTVRTVFLFVQANLHPTKRNIVCSTDCNYIPGISQSVMRCALAVVVPEI